MIKMQIGSLPGATLALLATAAIGCGETTDSTVDQLNLDRPTDIAFGCHGNLRLTNGAEPTTEQEVVVSAMPAWACEVRSGPKVPLAPPCQATTVTPAAPGQEDLYDAACNKVSAPLSVNWKGFVLQSGPGTVAIVDFPTGPAASLGGNNLNVKVSDVDQLTPGKNSISVGEDPVAIATDESGCHVLTANAGSCDLSVLEVTSALAKDPVFKVDRLAVKNASGTPIRSRPAAMKAAPSITTIGNMCPAQPTGLVYIAYPSCHLVAGVDAATGTIVTGVKYDAAGVPSIVGGNVTCPDECGGEAATPGVRPVALDLELDPDPDINTRRLAIGADNSSSITVVELDDTSRPLSLFRVALEDPRGDLGVAALAMSPQIEMGGRGDVITAGLGGPFQFVYAVATDNTVRVADILDVRTECDTQIDPRFARQVGDVRRLSCFMVGDPTNPPRRARAAGPGIRLPASDIPYSVDFIRSESTAPNRLIGYFAMISASSGTTYIAHVDDDGYPDLFQSGTPLAVSMPLAMAHQLQDGGVRREATPESIEFDGGKDDAGNLKTPIDCDYNGDFASNDALNGPRALATPLRNVSPGAVATEKLTQLPGFRQLLCSRHDTTKAVSELSFVVPDVERDRAFPDLAAVSTENWAFAWEGSLSVNRGANDVGGPAIRESMLFVDSFGMHLRDQTKPFCSAGVEPYDIVQLRGCDPSVNNADCPSGYTCFVHPESQIQGRGACMRSDEADRLAAACRDFLISARRYTVKTADSGELQLQPRRFELRTTPLDGCVSDNECQTLASYALRSASGQHPVNDTTAQDTHAWSCVADPARAPMGGTGKRCQMRCDITADCATGTICNGAVAGQAKSGFCLEGVTPPQACVNAPQRYELRAGEAFTVLGAVSGYVHPIITNAGGQCVKDPMASPLLAGRVPLLPKDRLAPNNLRTCDPAADPLTGKLPNGTFEPNPCSLTVAHTEVKPQYLPNTCTLADPPGVFVERQAPAVRFRNRSMTVNLVDPYYPGDAMCITDRGANLGKIPHVVPDYSLTFRVVAGFKPLALSDRATFPSRLVRGPAQTIWVMDQGDFLSSSAGAASTRGAVFVYDGQRLAAKLL